MDVHMQDPNDVRGGAGSLHPVPAHAVRIDAPPCGDLHKDNTRHRQIFNTAMASVSSLDQDMKKLRMGRYTPQAANEVRAWIEETLGEPLPAGDLLNALKDGTALCRCVVTGGCRRLLMS